MPENLNDLFAIAKLGTGLSHEEIVEAAVDPEKQQAALRKISENAKPQDVFKDAVDELRSDR